jgi:hypothetical protein
VSLSEMKVLNDLDLNYNFWSFEFIHYYYSIIIIINSQLP